jgi:tetratricopeptide (TPR) repeat protein
VLRKWLEKRAAIWVEIPGFDELMLLFKSEFEIANPNSNKFDQVFKNYLSTYSELERQVGQIPDSHPQASSLKGAAARAEASSTDWTAAYLRALFVGDQDLEEAEHLFRQGIEDFPSAPLLYVGLSYLLLGQARFEEALEWSQKAIELDPDTLNTAYARAETLAVAGHTQQALDQLSALVKKFPREILPRFGYGIFSARNGDLETGREQFKVITEISPSTAQEYALAAILADDCEYFEKGAEFHERAVSEDPGDGSLHANFARNLIARDEPDQASREIARANKLLPATDRASHLQAFFYEAAIADGEDRDVALTELRALLEIGTRLSTWSFRPVLEFCERKGDPEAPWLAKLAEVIAGRQDTSALETWPRWKDL